MKKLLLSTFTLFLIFMAATPHLVAQWSMDSLNSARNYAQAALVGNKAIFVNNNAEIYDIVTGAKTTKTFSVARTRISGASTPQKAWFAGGYSGPYTDPLYRKTVDIYTAATNTWTTTNLSQARVVDVTGRLGNKVFFAGGRTTLVYSKRVDIFNDQDNTRVTANLSQPREGMAVASAGNKIIFAGGEGGQMGFAKEKANADIYDGTTNTWSAALLSQKRLNIAAAGVGNKIIFAGGFNSQIGASDRIDIYDVVTNTWTTASLSEARYWATVAVADNKAYFVGGWNSGGYFTDKIDIYDATTDTWSSMTMSTTRGSMSAVVTNSRIMFAGGGIIANAYPATDRVEVFNRMTNTWSVEYLSSPRTGMAVVTNGNKAIFAGGNAGGNAPASKRLDIWTDVLQLIAAPAVNVVLPAAPATEFMSDVKDMDFTVYPNPASGEMVTLQFNSVESENMLIALIDMSGKRVREIRKTNTDNITETIDISGLSDGLYFIAVQSNGNTWTTKKLLIQRR
jgi:hypothetical protein